MTEPDIHPPYQCQFETHQSERSPGTRRECRSSVSGKFREGYLQIYCGTGKGKTTAALGLSMRVLLTGGSVFFAQFFKGIETAELGLCSLCEQFIIEQYGTGSFIAGLPSSEDTAAARKGFEYCKEILLSGYFDLVVLDEILLCIAYQIIPAEDLIEILQNRKSHVEVVLTGRKAPANLMAAADLVTEMKKVKHYFDRGVYARKGIEY